jgi:hypothetical protein
MDLMEEAENGAPRWFVKPSSRVTKYVWLSVSSLDEIQTRDREAKIL